MSDVRVYEMNECDYVAARSKEDALEFYTGYTGLQPPEDVYEDPQVVSDEQMERLEFVYLDENPQRRGTFAKALEECLANPKQQVPFVFASSEW